MCGGGGAVDNSNCSFFENVPLIQATQWGQTSVPHFPFLFFFFYVHIADLLYSISPMFISSCIRRVGPAFGDAFQKSASFCFCFCFEVNVLHSWSPSPPHIRSTNHFSNSHLRRNHSPTRDLIKNNLPIERERFSLIFANSKAQIRSFPVRSNRTVSVGYQSWRLGAPS